MAYAAFADRTIEAAFEQALCVRLAAAGHACTTMLQAAPPTREQDSASRHQASRASGAQAIIVIELADPATVSRRLIAASRPAYEISVIDNARQQVVARVFLETDPAAQQPVTAKAEELARRIVAALGQSALFYERSAY